MDDGSRLPWMISVLLLLFASYFAAAETGFASSSHALLKVLAESGSRKAQDALDEADSVYIEALLKK